MKATRKTWIMALMLVLFAVLVTARGADYAFDVANATYTGEHVHLKRCGGNSQDLFFTSNGARLNIISDTSNKICEFACADSYNSSSCTTPLYNLTIDDGTPTDWIWCNSTVAWALGAGDDVFIQYSCANDSTIQGCTDTDVELDVTAQDNGPFGFFFSTNRTKVWHAGRQYDKLYTYSGTVACDLSTYSYTAGETYDYTDETDDGFEIWSNGTKWWIISSNDNLYEYNFPLWDVNESTYSGRYADFTAQETNPVGFWFNDTGNKLYIVGTINDTVFEYNISFPSGPVPVTVTVNLNAPANNENITTTSYTVEYNGTISNGDHRANCTLMINGTNTGYDENINLTAGDTFTWAVGSESGGSYAVYVNCSADGATSANSSTSTVWVDNVNPLVSIADPTNETNYQDNAVPVLCTAQDANLYRFNLSVTDANGTVRFSHGALPVGTNYFNSTTITGGTMSSNSTAYHVVNCTVADSHTTEELKEVVIPEKPVLNRVEFDFIDDPISLVLQHDGDLVRFDPVLLTDRYAFSIEFSKPVTDMVFLVYGRDLTPVNSDYPCHLVTKKRWIDFDIPGVTSCELTARSGYYEARLTLKNPALEMMSNSVGELNIVSEYVYFRTVPSFALNWTDAGLVCGEKYPDNVFDLDFSGAGLSSCILRINDYLYDDWDAPCGQINVTVQIGRNNFELFYANNTLISDCNVWNDKQEKDLADFGYLFITILLIGALVVLGAWYGILTVLAGLLSIWLGFTLLAYSWVLGGAVVALGFLLMLWPLILEK